jgi:hypothetical protein
MTYEITGKLMENILRITIIGIWPEKDPKTIITDILDLHQMNQDYPILIDIRRMESTPSTFGDYEEVGLLVSAGFRRVSRIAVLDTLLRKEYNDFFETAAINQGLRLRFFYADEQEVSNWLIGKEDTSI